MNITRSIQLSVICLLAIFGLRHMSLVAQSSSVQKQTAATTDDNELIPAADFLKLLDSDQTLQAELDRVTENWNMAYFPMMLEVARFLPPRYRARVFAALENKTGQSFGPDFDRWFQWNWAQDFEPHPGYAKFKSDLYRKIDPRFAEYFADADNPKIRLDEIRWGGVRRDGIPPLKDPEMISAEKANKWLADDDVVFGIELNGDARCYPKRILAWHEMFKDTIGGESVCGVY